MHVRHLHVSCATKNLFQENCLTWFQYLHKLTCQFITTPYAFYLALLSCNDSNRITTPLPHFQTVACWMSSFSSPSTLLSAAAWAAACRILPSETLHRAPIDYVASRRGNGCRWGGRTMEDKLMYVCIPIIGSIFCQHVQYPKRVCQLNQPVFELAISETAHWILALQRNHWRTCCDPWNLHVTTIDHVGN